ncbi:MAG: hypothetical protein HZC28_16430 [Spirochaetes bacterium]|nr:hypothetical protein [Spirochaetota bacterium]
MSVIDMNSDGQQPRREMLFSRVFPVAAIVLCNLVPLAGVFFWHVNIHLLVIVFWWESIIVGWINLPKIAMAGGDNTPGLVKFGLMFFFLFHYFGFVLIQGIFIFIVFNKYAGPLSGGLMRLLIGVLAAGHVLSFFTDYIGTKANLKQTPTQQMMKPYGRVVVQQVMVFAGAWGMTAAGLQTNTVLLAVFVAVKTIADIAGHWLELAWRNTEAKTVCSTAK